MREGLERLLALKERCAPHRPAQRRRRLQPRPHPHRRSSRAWSTSRSPSPTGAVARTESRGSHARTDYPTRDDADWLKHTMAHYTPDGPRLDYKPVTLGTFEPQERKY